jgi:hypothetical protein
MLILSGLLALAFVAEPTDLGIACVQIDAATIHADVERVLAARGDDGIARSDAVGMLEDHWARVCDESKKVASSAVTADVARLLKIPAARFTSAELLFEIDNSLGVVRTPLAAAISDQNRTDRLLFKRAGPVMPSSGHFVLDSLRCVLRKLETGMVDAQLCRDIIADQRPN